MANSAADNASQLCTESKTHKEAETCAGLRFKNVEEVKHALSLLNEESTSLKESLLRCYLLNLMLYKQVDPDHPVKDMLIKLSVYISLLEKAKPVEQAQSQILKEAEKEENENENEERIESDEKNKELRRPINYVIEKNKVHTEKITKKREERNPRIKNKRRYQDAHDLAKKVRDTYYKR